MKLHTLFLLSVFCFLGVAAASEPETRLRAAVDEVLAVAAKSPNSEVLAKNIVPVLEKYLCFSAMTKRAVGPGWRELNPGQRDEATQLFATLITRTYSKKFTPGERPVIDFKPAVEPSPGRVDVPTLTQYQGSSYEVIYRMEQSEGWKVTDVIIEGVSLVANYRSQFDAQFKKGGADALLSALTKSVGQP